MIEYLNNLKGLINQLTKISSSLPESWDTLVATLSNSTPTRKLTMDTVIDSLLNEEVRRKERGLSIQSEPNFVDNHAGNKNRG